MRLNNNLQRLLILFKSTKSMKESRGEREESRILRGKEKLSTLKKLKIGCKESSIGRKKEKERLTEKRIDSETSRD